MSVSWNEGNCADGLDMRLLRTQYTAGSNAPSFFSYNTAHDSFIWPQEDRVFQPLFSPVCLSFFLLTSLQNDQLSSSLQNTFSPSVHSSSISSFFSQQNLVFSVSLFLSLHRLLFFPCTALRLLLVFAPSDLVCSTFPRDSDRALFSARLSLISLSSSSCCLSLLSSGVPIR